jgi:hypothetical protein
MPMRKKLFPTILIATIVIAGCGAKVSDKSARNEAVKKESVSVSDSDSSKVYEVSSVTSEYSYIDKSEMQTTEVQEPLVTDDDFETWGYAYESYGSTYYYLVVKNNSDIPVSIDGYGVAKDADGNVLDDSTLGFDVVGAGETQIANFIFLLAENVASFEYSLSYSTDLYYYPVFDDLDIQYNVNYDRNNVTFSVTNNGNYYADITPYCLFFDNEDNVIWAGYSLYFDSEIDPNETIYESMYISQIDNYDHAEVYFTGKGRGDRTYGTLDNDMAKVTDDDFSIKEYVYDYQTWSGSNDTEYYLAITNNSQETVYVSGEAIVKDAEGNLLSADSSASLDDGVLGPGETTICDFDFGDIEGYASIDYMLKYYEVKYYEPIVGDFTTDVEVNEKGVTLNVTNNGNKVGDYVVAVVLFMDESDKVVGVEDGYIIDSDGEIKPGATLTTDFSISEAFDHVEVYYKGESR